MKLLKNFKQTLSTLCQTWKTLCYKNFTKNFALLRKTNSVNLNKKSMKKFTLIFILVLIFDIAYNFLYDILFIDIHYSIIKYPLLFIKYIISSPANMYDRLLPFYSPIPIYQSILFLIGNVFIQSCLIFWIFFKKK